MNEFEFHRQELAEDNGLTEELTDEALDREKTQDTFFCKCHCMCLCPSN